MNDVGVDAVRQGNAGHRCTRLGALSNDLLLELGAVPPAGLLLGFIHGVHLNRWWTPSLPLRQIPSRVGWPRAYRQPERDGSLVCHSDRGSQYVSIRYTERLAEAGIEPSVGSKGDSYDNALAETINGLYKAELIHRRAPWKTKEAVEFATLEWVSWFNQHRLLEPIGYLPPAQAEANYYRQLASQNTEVVA